MFKHADAYKRKECATAEAAEMDLWFEEACFPNYTTEFHNQILQPTR
jgi:hypothetical protein